MNRRGARTWILLALAWLLPSAATAQPVSFIIGGGESVAAENGSLSVPAKR